MKTKRRFGKLSACLLSVVVFMTFIPSLTFGETNSNQSETEASYQAQEGAEWEDGTFAEALANVYDGGTIKLLKDIELTDTVTIEKKVTITSNDEGSPKKIIALTDQHGYMICVKNEVTMENVIIDGGGENDITASEAMIAVGSLIKSGKLTLGEGATLCNNNNTRERGAGGAVCVIFGDLIVSGGKITGNTAFAGAAIAVITNNANATINIGSVVSDNTATDSGYSGGGAIFISAGTFIMTGGEIKNNNAVNGGGAIFINKENDDAEAVCKLQGGTITANTAKYGAGIYASASSLIELSGGSVTDNTAAYEGGGIYAPPDNNIALSGTVVVDGNTASQSGDNVYLLYGPAVTIGQLNDTAKVDIFTTVNPETGNDLIIAEPAQGYTLTDNDISKLSYEDTNCRFKLIDGNVVLASTAAAYTVTFDANGGTTVTPTSATTGTDGKLTELPTPTRTGYKFNGWFDAQTGGTEVTTDTVFSANTTIYAQWTKKSSGGGGSSNTTTTTTKNDDGSTTKTTTNKGTGTTTETTTYPDGSTTKVETEKDGTVTTTEKDKDGNTTTTVENPDGSSTTTEKNKDGSETVIEKDAAGTTTTTEKDSDGNKTVTTEKPDGTTTTEETKKDGTTVKTETTASGETTAEVKAEGDAEVVIPVENAEDVTKVVVTDKDGSVTEVEFEVKDGGIAISVSGNSTVSVQTGHICYAKDFTDVDLDAWYHLNIDYVLEKGLMKGTAADKFAPNDNLTRAMLVTILHRAEGQPKVAAAHKFTDLEEGLYYVDAVAWAYEKGVVKGISETEFVPNDNITREQLAAMLHRFVQFKGYDVSVGEDTNILSYDDFDDIYEYAIPAMQWAVGSGLVKGKTARTLNPKDNATRAEAAAMLHRFMESNK